VVFMMMRDRPNDSRSSEDDNTVGLTCYSIACFCIATLRMNVIPSFHVYGT